MNTLVLVAEESHAEEGFPALGWGIGAFLILLSLLMIVLVMGKGRPHA
jgi:hypothetical protein